MNTADEAAFLTVGIAHQTTHLSIHFQFFRLDDGARSQTVRDHEGTGKTGYQSAAAHGCIDALGSFQITVSKAVLDDGRFIGNPGITQHTTDAALADLQHTFAAAVDHF